MSNYEENYRLLLRTILDAPIEKSRTGEVYRANNLTLSVDLEEGFPMLTGRKLFWKNIQGEAEWMLSGSTNVKDLHKWGVHIWDQWANSNGELGPTYGAQLYKQWEKILESIKNFPLSRRHIINLWNVDVLDQMTLPPCYYSLQFYVRDKYLNLTVTSRSSDAAVGLPYDIAVLAYLLHKAGIYLNMSVKTLCFNACDIHINIENVHAVLEYLNKPTWQLPVIADFKLYNYICGFHIPMQVKQ